MLLLIAAAAGILLALWALVLIGMIVYHLVLATLRGDRTEFCNRCGKTDVRPSWPAGILDPLLAVLHHYPYRCRACQYRYYRYRRKPPTVVP